MSVATEQIRLADFHHLATLYLKPNRPWLSLYNLRLPPPTSFFPEQCQIQRKLPPELMLKLFARLDPYELGKASCVCRQWRILIEHPDLWCSACMEAFSHLSFDDIVESVKLNHRSSWKKMFLHKPHLRFDGIYVSRNTYLRRGIVEWRNTKAVHLVTYFRYLRFWPSGKFLYCTTPRVPKDMAAIMGSPITTKKNERRPETFMSGHYEIQDAEITCAARYPGKQTVQYSIRVALRSTIPGANNRLDVSKIATTETGESDDEDVEMNYKRGLSSFVFIPWGSISTCIFNRPDEIDYHIA